MAFTTLSFTKEISSYKNSFSMLKSELEKLKQEKESNQLKIEKFDNASKSLDKLIGSQITDKSRKGVGFVSYNAVPPPPTGLFSPPKFDLSNSGLEEFQQPEFEGYGPKTSKSVSEDISNEVRESPDAPLVKELVLDDKLEKKTVFPTVAKIEFADCNYHQRERVVFRNNYTRVNYNYSAKKTHPSAHRNMVSKAVLMKTGLRSLNTTRPDNTAHPKTIIYSARPMPRFSKSAQSTVKRPYQIRTTLTNKNFSQKVNTAKGKFYTARPKAVNTARPNSTVVNAVRENQVNAVKASAYFKEFDGGYVTFGREPKKGKLMVKELLKLVIDQSGTEESIGTGHSTKETESARLHLMPLFTWVFFLASKDETSDILKRFITKIENLVDKKVKIIRCDNEIEFKNGVMREIGLIEATRTMLADSKLPTTFWVEAVNTACYVQNRVLVVKPHNKTPYELFKGRTPALCFMIPFGCHVTILNTLDYLGKFDGKSDEGFFVGYLMNSKAFRVYNIRTRKAEENFHIMFLNDKPIITGDGPKWLFDIDVRTKSMNFVPVVAGTNSNDFADGLLFDSSPKNASNDEPQPSSDDGKKDDKGVNKESGIDDQEKLENSTQDVNYAGPSINTTSTNVNTGSLNINIVSPTVTTALLEATHADFFGDETKIDMRNITVTYLVPSTLNTKIHKDHSLDHVIGDMQSGVQTRRMTKTTNEKGFISSIYEGKTHEDLHTCLFACFLSQEEPKKVYRNKKDERGIVIRNKARLVAQGYTQEEGIDYDEVFAPVARIKAIRLFLPYASFNDFIVYQMDVKSAFLYGKIEEEVYVCQPPGFEDLEFPDRVYKVEKALYGLHQAPRAWYETLSTYLLDNEFQRGQIDKNLFINRIKSNILLVQVYVDDIIFGSTKKELCTEFEKLLHKKFQMSSIGELTFFLGLQVTQKDDGIFICQDKYVDEILKKFSFSTAKTASSPMETSKPLMKDENVEDVDVHLYRSMIVSLMYLTALRPDIMFADSPFDLEAYTDSDYAGASLDRKSTTGVFLDKQVEGMTKHKEIYVTPSHTKKVFDNMKREGKGFSRRVTPLFQTMMVQALKKKQPRRKQRKNTKVPQPIGSTEPITNEAANEEHVPTHSNIPLLSGEDRMKLKELLKLCTKLSERVLDLENIKTSQAAEITKLKERVKKLERRNKSRTPGLKRLRKGRKIANLDADAKVTLVDEAQGRNDDLMFDIGVFDEQEVEVEKVVSTAEVTIFSTTTTTAVDELTLAQTLIEIKAAKPKAGQTGAYNN
ncbi:putative ribonuclease H-like domain-containing protein [Tanacetum coccineum]